MYFRTPKALYNHVWGGGGGVLSLTTTSVQHPLGWCYGCHRTTAPVRLPHTSYRWRGERVIEPIKWMGLLGGHDWQGPVEGTWPGHRGYTLLFTRSVMGFLMTTESQDLGLTSHPKDGALSQYSVPVTILGRWDPHRPQGEHPLLVSLTHLPAAT